LSGNASETSQFVATVADGAHDIEQAATSANEHGVTVEQSGKDVARLAENLKTRCVIFLRQTEFGDRRVHDRLPCNLDMTLSSPTDEIRGQTFDLSEGGVRGEIAEIGACSLRVVNRPHLGLHLQFVELPRRIAHRATR
jgi:methyl-accepting chemotaxis protein